jgi:cysteinyl-tRNA synthetase
VYDHSHLGHARSYVSEDIVYRLLVDYFGVPVFKMMGCTDVDDKIIQKALEDKQGADGELVEKDLEAVSRKYEKLFWDDLRDLNVLFPDVVLRVTEHIPEIIQYIQHIEKNGLAYVIREGPETGSVYFDHSAFEEKRFSLPLISKAQQPESSSSSVVVPGHSFKRRAEDFALWKKTASHKPGVSWESPWGEGRPGWHIECSAMIDSALSQLYKQLNHPADFASFLDLHSGGCDLKFPHHTNEILQATAFYHQPSGL